LSETYLDFLHCSTIRVLVIPDMQKTHG